MTLGSGFFFFFSLFPLPLSVHVCESFSEPFSHRRVQAHFLSRRDAASYANHPAVSAASSRPTSSPATAPSASFLSLSGLLMNVRTLLPYARLQLSGLETPSVFANVAPWLNPADISCLSSFPLRTHFSLCVTSGFKPLGPRTNVLLILSLFLSLQISVLVSITFPRTAWPFKSSIFLLLLLFSPQFTLAGKPHPHWWALRLWANTVCAFEILPAHLNFLSWLRWRAFPPW